MAEIGLKMLTKNEAATLSARVILYRVYMNKLRSGILEGIERGVDDEDDPLQKYIAGAAHLLKIWLSREGQIDRTLYEDEAPAMIERVREHFADFS